MCFPPRSYRFIGMRPHLINLEVNFSLLKSVKAFTRYYALSRRYVSVLLKSILYGNLPLSFCLSYVTVG